MMENKSDDMAQNPGTPPAPDSSEALSGGLAGELAEELAAVQELLQEQITALHPTLHDFFQGSQASPHRSLFALVVLAGALPPEDGPEQRRRRIALASALEMMAVALEVHKLLAPDPPNAPGGPTELDRSLVGATVLAGDFYFSRASALAARTDSPQVVALFSQLLMEVSEGNLAQAFQSRPPGFSDVVAMCRAGSQAAGILAGLPAPAQEAVTRLAAALGRAVTNPDAAAPLPATLLQKPALPGHQRPRWRQVLARFTPA